MIKKEKFQIDDKSWELNETGLLFLNQEVLITIDTVLDSEDPTREIFDEQLETLNEVFKNWDFLSEQIEKEIINYQNMPREELIKIANRPMIWLTIDYNTNLPEKDKKWSFVLGVTESEDFGFHSDFEGLTHLDTWAGG